MLIIPTDQKQYAPGHHAHGRPLNIAVELEEEGRYTVEVTVDIDPREAWRNGSTRPTDGVEAILAGADPPRPALELVAALVGEVRRLREIVDSATDEVTARLDPDQAKALAAALRHYAEEAERR